MVSALACRIRGREFESHDNHFPQNQNYYFFFISLSFVFIFLNFEVKQCVNIYWKYDNTRFAMKKKPNFLFFKMANTPHKGKTRHIAWLSIFLFQAQCFYRDEDDLAPVTWWQILYKRKRERFVVLTTFWKNDNSSCFWYTNSFNWKSSFVLIYYKSEDGYPNVLFSYLLLIALYTNSIYIIWLKKYSVVFYFLNF